MDNQDNQNITNDNSYPVDRNRDLVAEKLIMNELLNSEDFETLLQTTEVTHKNWTSSMLF